MTSKAVSALIECELEENNNLIEMLSLVKSSKTSQKDAKLASIVRGLCTRNSQLLSVLRRADLADNLGENDMDAFKLLVNDFILWFEESFVVFEKYLLCFPLEYDYAVFGKPILHVGCYIAFIDSVGSKLRNPFVVDRLNTFRAQLLDLLGRYSDLMDISKLQNISFDNIQASGKNVSLFFTVDQIVERTRNEPLLLGDQNIELLLLNLSATSASKAPYNALAVLGVPATDGPRAVLFPPFRVNELAIALQKNQVHFKGISLIEHEPTESFSVSGKPEFLSTWFSKLTEIFPTNSKLVSSSELQLAGLGINTVLSEESGDEASSIIETYASEPSPCISNRDESSRTSEDSQMLSMSIMKKTLSNHGLEPVEEVKKSFDVVDGPELPASVRASFVDDDAGSIIDSDNESIGCFEMVKPKFALASNAVSLPDLSATLAPPTRVYRNAAGSAVDISNFGKNYNPSFASLEDVKASPNTTRTRRKSIFSIFKKNKSKEALHDTPEKSLDNQPAEVKEQEQEKPQVPPKGKTRPPLFIEVPKIGESARSVSMPLSATSATFARPLPLPFALPSSTSQYFFKPHKTNNEIVDASKNDSTTSLALPENDSMLQIPQHLKDVINSDESIDFYISPTSPKALKVSKWKPKYGKWEMLTTNNNIFVKIVANYEQHRSWLLVFKEEFDEEYNEMADVPLLIVNLDLTTKVRQSSALDVELNCVNAVTGEKLLVIMRCNGGALMDALQCNLENILGVMNSKKSLLKSNSGFDSNNTISSSLMTKPSASSTLTSIYTALDSDEKQSPTHRPAARFTDSELIVLLDRMTIRLHQQMESYEKIYQLSSWKTLAMCALRVSHCDEEGFRLSLEGKEDGKDVCKYSWVFAQNEIFDKVEKIGKAGLLVKAGKKEIYMLECKGKKDFKRLYDLF